MIAAHESNQRESRQRALPTSCLAPGRGRPMFSSGSGDSGRLRVPAPAMPARNVYDFNGPVIQHRILSSLPRRGTVWHRRNARAQSCKSSFRPAHDPSLGQRTSASLVTARSWHAVCINRTEPSQSGCAPGQTTASSIQFSQVVSIKAGHCGLEWGAEVSFCPRRMARVSLRQQCEQAFRSTGARPTLFACEREFPPSR